MIYYLLEGPPGPGLFRPLSPGRCHGRWSADQRPWSNRTVCGRRPECTRESGGGPGARGPCYPNRVPYGIWTECSGPARPPRPGRRGGDEGSRGLSVLTSGAFGRCSAVGARCEATQLPRPCALVLTRPKCHLVRPPSSPALQTPAVWEAGGEGGVGPFEGRPVWAPRPDNPG